MQLAELLNPKFDVNFKFEEEFIRFLNRGLLALFLGMSISMSNFCEANVRNISKF